MNYPTHVWPHIQAPHNRGPLPEANGHGSAYYHPCGDRLQLHLHTDGQRILAIRFEARACAPVLAVASIGTDHLQGLMLEQARALNSFELDGLLGGLPPSKRHAYLMFLECLHEALKGATDEPALDSP